MFLGCSYLTFTVPVWLYVHLEDETLAAAVGAVSALGADNMPITTQTTSPTFPTKRILLEAQTMLSMCTQT